MQGVKTCANCRYHGWKAYSDREGIHVRTACLLEHDMGIAVERYIVEGPFCQSYYCCSKHASDTVGGVDSEVGFRDDIRLLFRRYGVTSHGDVSLETWDGSSVSLSSDVGNISWK